MSYRQLAVASVLGIATGTVGACTSFGADREGGPANDGRSDTDSAPVVDPRDDQSDAAPTPSCEDAGFVFCDDFERDTVKGLWRTPVVKGASTLAISTQFFVSPSRSLEVSIPEGDASSQVAFLARKPGIATRRFRVAFSLRYDAVGADIQVVNIGFADSTFLFLTLTKDVDQAVLKFTEQRLKAPDGGGGFNTTTPPLTVIDKNVWTRFELSIDLTTRAVTMKRFDGTSVEKIPNLTLEYGATDLLSVGAVYVASPRDAARSLSFDDVFYSAE